MNIVSFNRQFVQFILRTECWKVHLKGALLTSSLGAVLKLLTT
jgi:hypothetical protein